MPPTTTTKARSSKNGRPRKNGVKEPWHLGRTLRIIEAYRVARERGEKRESAIEEAVLAVKQFDPDMPVSKTEVKRVLAEFASIYSDVSIRAESTILEGESAAEKRRFAFDMMKFADKYCVRSSEKLPVELTEEQLHRPLTVISFGYARRPVYKRHNSKS